MQPKRRKLERAWLLPMRQVGMACLEICVEIEKIKTLFCFEHSFKVEATLLSLWVCEVKGWRVWYGWMFDLDKATRVSLLQFG